MALIKTYGIYAITLVAAFAITSDAFAQERKQVPVAEILAEAAAEKALVERSYRANQAAGRANEGRTEQRTISVEIGDGLAPEGELAGRAGKGQDRSYREKEAVAKLEREWKEVNKAMKRAIIEKIEADQKL